MRARWRRRVGAGTGHRAAWRWVCPSAPKGGGGVPLEHLRSPFCVTTAHIPFVLLAPHQIVHLLSHHRQCPPCPADRAALSDPEKPACLHMPFQDSHSGISGFGYGWSSGHRVAALSRPMGNRESAKAPRSRDCTQRRQH